MEMVGDKNDDCRDSGDIHHLCRTLCQGAPTSNDQLLANCYFSCNIWDPVNQEYHHSSGHWTFSKKLKKN